MSRKLKASHKRICISYPATIASINLFPFPFTSSTQASATVMFSAGWQISRDQYTSMKSRYLTIAPLTITAPSVVTRRPSPRHVAPSAPGTASGARLRNNATGFASTPPKAQPSVSSTKRLTIAIVDRGKREIDISSTNSAIFSARNGSVISSILSKNRPNYAGDRSQKTPIRRLFFYSAPHFAVVATLSH